MQFLRFGAGPSCLSGQPLSDYSESAGHTKKCLKIKGCLLKYYTVCPASETSRARYILQQLQPTG